MQDFADFVLSSDLDLSVGLLLLDFGPSLDFDDFDTLFAQLFARKDFVNKKVSTARKFKFVTADSGRECERCTQSFRTNPRFI